MNTQKHTPDWEVVGGAHKHDKISVWSGNKKICDCETIEDARLIAAAPDLLERAIWTNAKLSDFMDKVPAESQLWKDIQKVLLDNSAAIAKARGG